MKNETTTIQDSQTYTIGDFDPSTLSEEPLLIKCDSCGKISEEDNFLGHDPYTCKHWCNKCFAKIKLWIERKNLLRGKE